jgi:hypothetical protein
MNPEEQRIERLIAMAERLIAVLESDIAALKAGKPREMRTIEPEILRLSALYSREASGLNPNATKSAPAELRRKLFDATGRFRELLNMQMRLLTRMRGATEGMVRAVAEEVERRRAPLSPYGATGRTPRPTGSMLYNSVV